MKVDNEEQRNMLLDLLNAATFQGTAIDKVATLKKAIVNATSEG